MNVLVAGGAGFVGSHLCRALVARGFAVWALDNLSSGRRANVADLLDNPLFTLEEGDVTEPGLEIIGPAEYWDLIYHLASPASPVDYDRYPIETLAANSLGTWHLVELATIDRCPLVYASTSEVYGDPLVHPQPETYWGNVDPIGPRSQYDEGKRFGEALITAARHEYHLEAAIVRIFNTYGPAMRLDDGRVIPEMLSAALREEPLPIHGDGRQTRSFMYVDDLVDALLLVGLDPDLDGLVANVGNPDERSIWDVGQAIHDATGSASGYAVHPGRPGDPRQRCPDISVMRQRYGWMPRIPFDLGLRMTVEWVQRYER